MEGRNGPSRGHFTKVRRYVGDYPRELRRLSLWSSGDDRALQGDSETVWLSQASTQGGDLLGAGKESGRVRGGTSGEKRILCASSAVAPTKGSASSVLPRFYSRDEDDRPYTRQARLSSSLRNQLRQREKLANPSIHDFATTG